MKSGILHVGLFTLLVGTVAILFSKAEKGRIERPGNLTQHTTAENFRFTNPNIVSTFNPEQFNSLKKEVLSYIDKKISEGKAQSVSVYYFNLRNESTIGISEHELYMPASLMKVLIMIAALKKSESDTAFLQKEARYEVAAYPDISPNVETENLIQLGKSYSLKELMRRMIVFSDNEAMDLLVKHFSKDFCYKTSTDLGINLNNVDISTDYMSTAEFSLYFKALYNATYLNRENSEMALEMLSQTTFNEGIVGGTLKGINVAHKYGERATSDKRTQLHDCGIVYFPGEPYLLCIMTKGKYIEELATVISGVSAIVCSYHQHLRMQVSK